MCDKCEKYRKKDYQLCPKCGTTIQIDIEQIKENLLFLYRSYAQCDEKERDSPSYPDKPHTWIDKLGSKRLAILNDIKKTPIPVGTTLFYVYDMPFDQDNISNYSKPHCYSTNNNIPIPSKILTANELEQIYPILRYFDNWTSIVVNTLKNITYSCSYYTPIYLTSQLVLIPYSTLLSRLVIPVGFKERIGTKEESSRYPSTEANYSISALPISHNMFMFSGLGKIKRSNIMNFIIELYQLDILEESDLIPDLS